MVRQILMVLMVSSINLGCFTSDLDLKIRFDQINGLQAQERVLFEGNKIGTITDVFYEKDGTYLVDVAIHPDFKNAVTGNSRFFIVKDPSDPSSMAVEMVTVKGKGQPLEDGAVVKGATRLSALLEKMENDMSSAMDHLKKRFENFSEELERVPEDEDVKRFQEDLDQLLDEMKRSGRDFRDKVQKDLVPRLQEEIDRLKERLKELGREKEAEPLQTRMDDIRRI